MTPDERLQARIELAKWMGWTVDDRHGVLGLVSADGFLAVSYADDDGIMNVDEWWTHCPDPFTDDNDFMDLLRATQEKLWNVYLTVGPCSCSALVVSEDGFNSIGSASDLYIRVAGSMAILRAIRLEAQADE